MTNVRVRESNQPIGIGEGLAALPLPHHRAYGSVHGGSIRLSAHASSLHQLLGVCRAFGRARRRLRVGPLRRGLRGFTPSARREGQLQLVVLPLAAHEITPPTCRSRSFGPSSAVSGSAYPFAASFDLAVPHEPRRQHGLLCPLLTSATRSDHLTVASVRVLRRGHAADLPR